MSTQGMVREAAMRLGLASVRELQQVTGLIGKRGWARVYRAVGELRKAGWLERVGYGVYAYQEIEPRKHETLKRIWSTIRHLRKFTATEVRLLSGASSDHVKKYITRLRRLGYIQPVGRKAIPGQDARVTVYQLIEEKAGQGMPTYRRPRRKPDPTFESWEGLKEAAYELVRELNHTAPREGAGLARIRSLAEQVVRLVIDHGKTIDKKSAEGGAASHGESDFV